MFEKLTENFFRTPTPKEVFKNIVAKDDLVEIVERSTFTENFTQTLLVGPPGTAKTLIVQQIAKKMRNTMYYDGTSTSGRGFVDSMFEHQNCEIVCIDEIDKLSKKEQAILYNFLQSREIHYETKSTKYNFKMEKCKVVIATSNSLDKLSKPLKSRFAILHIPEYTYEEFVQISVKVLGDEYKILPEVATAIANVIWNTLGIKDARMLAHVGARIRKEDRADDIERLIILMQKYGQITNAEFN